MSQSGQNLPSRDFCGTAASPPETRHCSARLARQKSANSCREQLQQASVEKPSLFDHLVGRRLQGLWHGQTERLCSFEIDRQYVFGRLLYR
jgi:hypothetical protein